MLKNYLLIVLIIAVLLPVCAYPVFRSVDGSGASFVGVADGSKGGSLIAEIAGPAGWDRVWGVAYHDNHNMLYISHGATDELAYGSYSGGDTVSWTIFDNLAACSGMGCYDDNTLYAITQSNPPDFTDPFYLCTWQLNGSGIPGTRTTYTLGSPFTGAMGSCEWDGDYLWILDQNWDKANAIVYKYDVDTHSVEGSWSYSELGGVGVACVWDASSLYIWISDWYGGAKLVEHSDSGTETGLEYTVSCAPNDIAYKYEGNFDGPGFFVGDWDNNKLDFYDHGEVNIESRSLGSIKAVFVE